MSEPKLLRDVFLAPSDVLSAGEASALFEPFVGAASLFLLDGPPHTRHRRMLSGPLREARMQEYTSMIIACADRVARSWRPQSTVSFYDAAREITLEVLVRVLFGPKGAEALVDLRGRVREMVDICAKPHLLLAPARIDLGPWSPWGRVTRTMRALDNRIHAHISAMRNGDACANDGPATVLELMLAARDESGQPLEDSELRDELVTLLVAGNETTATAVAWTLDEILRVPGLLGRLEDESERVISRGPLRSEHISNLPLLEACVRESLRLHPPILNTIRIARKPFRLGAWEIPPGTEVAPCMYLTHRRADLFPNPLAFEPQRFLSAEPEPYTFFPFGGGNRRCMGLSLALWEIKVMLAHLLREHSFSLASARLPCAKRRALLMAPDTGVPVVVVSSRGGH